MNGNTPSKPRSIAELRATLEREGWIPTEQLLALLKEMEELRQRIAGYESWERSINEALNSGDGAYRP